MQMPKPFTPPKDSINRYITWLFGRYPSNPDNNRTVTLFEIQECVQYDFKDSKITKGELTKQITKALSELVLEGILTKQGTRYTGDIVWE